MFREIKDKFHKVRPIFTAGLLLFTLYSKTSIAVENSLENRYSSSIVATQIIYFLSQFFPVLQSFLENMLPKHINDNHQLLYPVGNFKGGISSSPGWFSVGGKYKNSQFSLPNLKPRLISFSPSLSSSYLKSSVFVGPLEPEFQNIDSNLSRNETLIPNLGHFYSPIRDFLPSHEKRRENFIPENIPVIKQGFNYVSNETQETKSKVSFSSYDNIFMTAKNLSSNLLTKTKEAKQDLSFYSINYQFKEPENFKVKPKNEHVNELPIKSTVEEVQEHHLENRTEETVYVKVQSETTSRVDILAEVSKMSELQPEERQENQNEKRSEQKTALNLDITLEPFLEKEIIETVKKSSPAKPFKNAAAPWAANLSPEKKRLSPLPAKAPKKHSLASRQFPFKLEFELAEKESRIEGSTPPPPPIVRLLSQSQLRNDKSSINPIKELDQALQKGGLKLPKESGILLALQKLVKDQKLKLDEIHALAAKLSEQVNVLIKKVYKVTIKEFENHILHLVQPQHKSEATVDLNQGFKQLSDAALELWRTKLLTDYIEKSIFKEQPLPTAEEVTSVVNKVVMQRFEEKLSSTLSPQLKQNATINIKSTFQKSLLYWNSNDLSNAEKNQRKKEILAQLFKLLVLDPKFQVQTKKKKDKNETIVVNIGKLQGATYPLIIQAVHQLYGHSYVFNLQKNILQEYIKIHNIFEGLESFSENERDKIFASVLQELQELREREARKEQEEQNKQEKVKKPESRKFHLFGIIQHENNDLLKKLIIQSVEKVWDSSRALALGSKSVQLSNEISGNSSSALLSSFSPEEIVKQSDSWLTDRLLELLPGSSQEAKLEFWFKIAEQDRILATIRSSINEAQTEAKADELRIKEGEVFKRTYTGIIQSIFAELGSQRFAGSDLRSQPALYRDVKNLIEDYLSPNTGFPDVIERTEQALRQSLKKAITSLEVYKLINSIINSKKYVIKARSSGTKSYAETPSLEVPKFVPFFTLPYWLSLKERLVRREESDKELQEKKKLKRQSLLEKLDHLFFDKKIKYFTKPLHTLNDENKENLPKQQVQKSSPIKKTSPKKPLQSIPQSTLSNMAPPPPPIPQKITSAKSSKVVRIEMVQQDIRISLKKVGLNVGEASPSLELLLRYKLQNRSLESSVIARQLSTKLRGIFYQTLGISTSDQTQEKIASIFGVRKSATLISELSQKLDTELPNYLLESLTIEDIDPSLTAGVRIDALAKKMNSKLIEITTAFVKLHFKEAVKKFVLNTELADKDFETLSLYVKNKLSKYHRGSTEDEKLELVLGAFIRILDQIEHVKDFTFPKKVSEKDKDQLILNVEEFKSTIIHSLNEVIAQKFNGSRPFIKVPTYKEEVKIEPSEVLPLLGKSFLQSAFTILPGSDEKEKVSLLIKYNSDQLLSLIEDVLNLRTNYDYKTTENQDKSIVFTRYTTKIFKEVITERYKGFSKALLSSQRAMILRSVDSFSLLSALLNNQLGDKPTTHTLAMSSPHDRKKKIEKKETISAFDILLSLPKIWKNKQKIEEKRKREVEEQHLKELTMARRVQTLQKFIHSEIEIQS